MGDRLQVAAPSVAPGAKVGLPAVLSALAGAMAEARQGKRFPGSVARSVIGPPTVRPAFAESCGAAAFAGKARAGAAGGAGAKLACRAILSAIAGATAEALWGEAWWWRMDSNRGGAVRNPSEDQEGCESGESENAHGSAHGFVQLWHELAQVVRMWPWVSGETRKAILTLLRAAHGGGDDPRD